MLDRLLKIFKNDQPRPLVNQVKDDVKELRDLAARQLATGHDGVTVQDVKEQLDKVIRRQDVHPQHL